ncbi:MAG: superoxide dismutase family protein [Proteobacteria bacterium]|nr:superoxide dismutase family protein [Pseudomonadota bacterium]
MKTVLLASLCAVGLIGCSSAPPVADASGAPAPAPASAPVSTAESATVNLASASGSLVSGKLKLVPSPDGVRVAGEIGGLTANSSHGIHIHQNGDCSAADASSAGGHFAPAGNPHGKVDAPTHHAGDMNNISANAEGVAQVEVHARNVTLGGGAANDVAGRAVIVHAQPDDYTSQPSGDAGARVACGVIRVDG